MVRALRVPRGPTRAFMIVAGAVALALALGGLFYILRPSALTDDTYAFLDWGRDVSQGLVPDIAGRTFHPLPVLYGTVVSVLGNGALPFTTILSLAGLLLLAAGAWRLTALLGVRQPGPALAAVLVVINPMLPALALASYVNLPFAILVLWAAVGDLEGDRRRAWTLLLVAGLVRPEGWLYLLAYAGVQWWRSGPPFQRNTAAKLLTLALAPMAVWIAVEWIAFGTPLYSFTHTAKLAEQSTHLGVVQELWNDVRDGLTKPLIPFSLAGIAWLVLKRGQTATRRAGALALFASAPASMLVLAGSGLNLPSRHFSVVVAFAIVLAAASAMWAAEHLPGGRLSRLGAAVILVALALSASLAPLGGEMHSVRVARQLDRSLAAVIGARRAALRSLPLGRRSVAILGGIAQSEVAWLLDIPYGYITAQEGPTMRVIIQPSQAFWLRLSAAGLTDRHRSTRPAGWSAISSGQWEIYLAPGLAARLASTSVTVSSSGRQRTLGSMARVMTRS